MFEFLREPVGYLLQQLVLATVVFRKYFPVLSEENDPFNAKDYSEVLLPEKVVAISKEWERRLNRHTLYYPPSQHKWFKRHEALARHYASQNAFREAQVEACAREATSLTEAKHYLARIKAQSRSLDIKALSANR